MPYVRSILTRYRYWILALLSLLLISEMVVADIALVPIEYKWVFGWVMLLTMLAWTGIICVIGVGESVGEDLLERRGNITLILSPALLAMSILSPLFAMVWIIRAVTFGATMFTHSFLLIVVWIGIVVILETTASSEYSRKIYLRMGVFPLLVVAWIMLFWTVVSELVGVTLSIGTLTVLFGGLFIVLPSSLVVGVFLRRSTLADRPHIVVALVAIGISVVTFVSVTALGRLIILSLLSSGREAPIVGLFLLVLIPVLWSLTICVFGTKLIGTMCRSFWNITVAIIGMVTMILFLWHWYLKIDNISGVG